MKASDLLKRAKSLIDTPDKWTRGRYAADHNGKSITVADDEACKFCSTGSIVRVRTLLRRELKVAIEGEGSFCETAQGGKEKIATQISEAAMRANKALDAAVVGTHIPIPGMGDPATFDCTEQFNDHTGTSHEDLMKVWDKAIAEREAAGD